MSDIHTIKQHWAQPAYEALSMDVGMTIIRCGTEGCQTGVIFTEETMINHTHPECRCRDRLIICFGCANEPNKCPTCAIKNRRKKKRKLQDRLRELQDEYSAVKAKLFAMDQNPSIKAREKDNKRAKRQPVEEVEEQEEEESEESFICPAVGVSYLA